MMMKIRLLWFIWCSFLFFSWWFVLLVLSTMDMTWVTESIVTTLLHNKVTGREYTTITKVKLFVSRNNHKVLFLCGHWELRIVFYFYSERADQLISTSVVPVWYVLMLYVIDPSLASTKGFHVDSVFKNKSHFHWNKYNYIRYK